jgi:hypothetical protein
MLLLNYPEIIIQSTSILLQLVVFYSDLSRNSQAVPNVYPSKGSPNDLNQAQIENCKGQLSLCLPREALKRRFPKIAACLPDWQVAVLLANTKLVGMKCPGLNSIFFRITTVLHSC